MLADLGLSRFNTALLSQSLTTLRNVLRASPRCVDEVLPYNQTGAHVASHWPAGLADLVAAGIDINRVDTGGYTALKRALRARSVECVQILLGADCAILSNNSVLDDVFVYESIREKPGTASMAVIVTEAVVDRRKRLQQLAFNRLPEGPLQALHLHQGVPLDEKAFEIQQALKEYGVDVPVAIQVAENCGPIWRCTGERWMTTSVAQQLWDSGFRALDIEMEDSYKVPLLLAPLRRCSADRLDIIRAAALTKWLCSKLGVDKEGFHQRDLTCTVASAFGNNYHFRWFMDRSSGDAGDNASEADTQDGLDFMAFLFRNGTNAKHHGCLCACSSDGCTALDRFFRAATRRAVSRRAASQRATRCYLPVLWVESLAGLIQSDSALWDALSPRMIRAVLFQWMELKHTCCQCLRSDYEGAQKSCFSFWFSFSDPERTQEIRDEHAEAIERFEVLLAELLEEYRISGMNLIEWLKGPFSERVEEIKLTEREPDKQYLESVFATTGVQLETDDDTEDYWLYLYDTSNEDT